MSNRSEINRKYREKKIQEDAEYINKESARRQFNRVKQRRNRNNERSRIELETNESKDDLITSILELNPEMKYDTIRQYVIQTGRIYEDMHKNKFNYKNFDWLREHEKVFKFLNNYYINVASKRTYIGRIYNLIQFFIGYENLIDIYREYKNKIDVEYDTLKDENLLSQNEKKLWMQWDEILEKTKDIKNSRDNLLIQMYTRIPPRRTRAYALLKIVRDTKPLEDLPIEYNYAVFNDNNELLKLILNQYKTVGKYKKFINDKIPDSIKKASKQYFEDYKLKIGNPLFFGRNKNNHYDNTQFSGVIKQTFKRYLDKALGTTALRHSYISWWFQNNPNPSVKQLKNVTLGLGHSIEMMNNYKRLG
jgi:hypothetical protein